MAICLFGVWALSHAALRCGRCRGVQLFNLQWIRYNWLKGAFFKEGNLFRTINKHKRNVSQGQSRSSFTHTQGLCGPAPLDNKLCTSSYRRHSADDLAPWLERAVTMNAALSSWQFMLAGSAGKSLFIKLGDSSALNAACHLQRWHVMFGAIPWHLLLQMFLTDPARKGRKSITLGRRTGCLSSSLTLYLKQQPFHLQRWPVPLRCSTSALIAAIKT